MTCALRGEKPPKEDRRCKICNAKIRSYWFHYHHMHPKDELVRLILKLLKIPKTEWHKKRY